jgi:hypothetical protein
LSDNGHRFETSCISIFLKIYIRCTNISGNCKLEMMYFSLSGHKYDHFRSWSAVTTSYKFVSMAMNVYIPWCRYFYAFALIYFSSASDWKDSMGKIHQCFSPIVVSFVAPSKSSSGHRPTPWYESVQTCSESCRSGINIWRTFRNVSQGTMLSFIFILRHLHFSYSSSSCLMS